MMLSLGCPLNEIAQAKLRYFIDVDGVACFDVKVGDPTQRLNNTASARTIPLHPHLLRLGLLEYVAQSRSETADHPNAQVFPAPLYRKELGDVHRIGSWMNGENGYLGRAGCGSVG